MDYNSILKSTSMLGSLAPEHMKKIADIATVQRVSPGTTIFSENQPGSGMYVIALGTVNISKRNEYGEDEHMVTLGSGSTFGEVSVATDTHLRAGTATAAEWTTLLNLEQEQLLALCETDPAFGMAFYSCVASLLARRLNSLSADVSHYRMLWRERRQAA